MKKEEKNEILGQRLDKNELDKVSAGMHGGAEAECPNAGIVGACMGPFYVEACHATVEAGSKCWSNDFLWSDYTVNQAARFEYNAKDHKGMCTWLVLFTDFCRTHQ